MKILNKIFENITNDNISGITDELKVQYILYLFEKEDNILVLTNSLYEATKFYNYLKTYVDNVFLFPMDEFITSVAIASSPDLKIKRLETLNKIKNNRKCIIITNLTGFLKFVPTSETLEKLKIILKKDEKINRKNLEELINKFGYKKESLVTSTGEYSIRGYIIDIFPIEYENPIRIELFGNNIESIKEFESETQLSIKQLDEIRILPYEEINNNKYTNILNLLENPLLINIEEENILKGYKTLQKQITEYKNTKNIDQEYKYMYQIDEIKTEKIKNLSTFNTKNSLDIKSFELDNISNETELTNFINNNLKNHTIIIYSNNKTLNKNIEEKFIVCKSETYENGKIYLRLENLNKGFIIDNYIIISENDIVKTNKNYKYTNPVKIGRKIKNFNELKKGDYVVHLAHGIGIYNGVVTLNKGEIQKDYLLINYAGTDKIYIPVEKIDTIFKYSDADGTPPKINKLNSISWQKTKNSVKSKIKDISKELLKLYAERSKIKSPKYKTYPEEEIFSSSFEYKETKDQIKCINEILADLKTDKPMDRLLCGDVGFGKTEVAFRAIFNTILNNYQVAYLCPTTILSKQQYQNAKERFKDYPINIAVVNRFTSSKDFNKIIKELEEGKIDLLFGTHKLFNEKIKFKNLGLLIVDEEQRFGVSQKEKIKALAKNINILTLSATPIPRTLKMAISGLKDLSILDTAPDERYPVQTYVVEENDILIKEIIYKELMRKGQIFYLFNNVSKIENEVNKLKTLVPEANITFAHGQMDKNDLEQRIEDFIEKKFDILVCTTIIETGIDISNVNTLIIIDAQNYGLSQLYQLRGRVGRSNKIAYAYLMYNNSKILSEIATKRLNAIKEFTELGSGYKIAMRDLSIRGAGDLLGQEQAGFIDSVGIELYTKLIEDTLKELKGEVLDEETEKNLLNVDTHIDNEYVKEDSIRIEIHQLINKIKDYKSLIEIKTEIEDRFGKISETLEIYMYEEWFEKLAYKLGIKHLVQTKDFVEITLPVELSNKIDGEKLFIKLYNINQKFKIKYISKRIIINLPIKNLEKHYLHYLLQLLQELETYTE